MIDWISPLRAVMMSASSVVRPLTMALESAWPRSGKVGAQTGPAQAPLELEPAAPAEPAGVAGGALLLGRASGWLIGLPVGDGTTRAVAKVTGAPPDSVPSQGPP